MIEPYQTMSGTKRRIVYLSQDNFDEWKLKLRSRLGGLGLLQYVDPQGEEAKQAESPEKKFAAYDEIVNTIPSKLFYLIMNMTEGEPRPLYEKLMLEA